MNHRLKITVLKRSAACSDLLLHRPRTSSCVESVFNTICRVGEKFKYHWIFRECPVRPSCCFDEGGNFADPDRMHTPPYKNMPIRRVL
jgi:hypothetical protein